MNKSISLVVLFIVAIAPCATALMITDVEISPEQPSISDIITIETEGAIAGGGIYYNDSNFFVDNYSIHLDIYFTDHIGTAVPKPWFHDEVIGTLAQGNYDLLVQSYWRSSETAEYILSDDYSTSLQVVPEPLTLIFMAIGATFIRRK